MINPNQDGLILCPNCNKMYKPTLTRKTNLVIQAEHPQATKEQREQLISGLCSNKCFNQFVGLPFTSNDTDDDNSVVIGELRKEDGKIYKEHLQLKYNDNDKNDKRN